METRRRVVVIEGIPVVGISGTSLLVLVAMLVITRRLIWHKDAEKNEAALTEDRNYWRGVAMKLLGVTEKLTVQGEVTNDLLNKLPDASEAGDPP